MYFTSFISEFKKSEFYFRIKRIRIRTY